MKKTFIFLWFISFLFSAPNISNSQALAEVYNLRHFTHPNFTRIVIDVGVLREYVYNELRQPARIYVDVFQVKLNPILHEQTFVIKNDYLDLIRIAQKEPSTVRVVVELDFNKVERYQVFHVFDPFRIVIDIFPKGPRLSDPSPKAPQPPVPTKSGYSMARQLGLGIKTIVIDPGHGGEDPGCMDRTGEKEKDIVLDVSLRLKALLDQNKDLRVVLTRETDIFIPLENRTVIANQQKADLFISIHVNSSTNRNLRGIETFYLNFSPDLSVNETAARENATSAKNISEMEKIIKKIVRNSKIIESKDLAEKIQNHLIKHISRTFPDTHTLGTKGGPFWVLIGGEMPSVLIEVSYLSNIKNAQRLKSVSFRQLVAEGIFQGIMEYIHSLGKA
ncbi:MAG: N-acetylmuramoyl-L-alanine amidase [Candidatus Aminicenantales bacterium]